MSKLERISIALFVALVAMLPFELQTFPILSSLQWLFLAIALTSLPLVFWNRRRLFADRRVIAAVIFVSVECLSALASADFRANAAKGAALCCSRHCPPLEPAVTSRSRPCSSTRRYAGILRYPRGYLRKLRGEWRA